MSTMFLLFLAYDIYCIYYKVPPINKHYKDLGLDLIFMIHPDVAVQAVAYHERMLAGISIHVYF
jgi:hypothetical protein